MLDACLQGLRELHQQHDCNYVQVRLSFKRGLHPFYPPMLGLLHPRMRGPVNGALASHPVAQLQHWDPWGTQRELAAKLKAFLQVLHPCLLHLTAACTTGMTTLVPKALPCSATYTHIACSIHNAYELGYRLEMIIKT